MSAPEQEPDNEELILNYQQNMQDAIDIMYKLQTGIDVNVKFTSKCRISSDKIMSDLRFFTFVDYTQTFSHTVMCKVCLTASKTLFDANAFVRLNH